MLRDYNILNILNDTIKTYLINYFYYSQFIK